VTIGRGIGAISCVSACRWQRRGKRDLELNRRKACEKANVEDVNLDGRLLCGLGPAWPQKWLFDTADDESNAWELSFLKDVGYHAMGHDTYRVMAGFWPVSNDSFSDLMNAIPKLVFTRKGLDADDAAITPRAVEEARTTSEGKAVPNDDVIRIFLWTSIPAIRYDIGLSSWERRACLVASIRVASYRRAKHGDAQLFGQSRTLRIKQLLGLAYSMANLDLAAPSAAILHKRRFSCLFAGLRAQLQPVAEIVQCGEPHRKINRIKDLHSMSRAGRVSA
jgi:hypothetical protein